ncbi:Txe/YoeB family addiction module toxin [Pedobacter changchengzhani]|uniref:Putative mRNA interferase YoeB n=1 Tax=Pedobacter changchengzhani TaxID=2529274 RepID=A0A4R5MQN4_9SPHI|nr:Txe/YoeB family addiction module toxin [Pedobacter changchengzhani]TDG37735.1 Txe/YoeB family addiction module toxin [Pedobacter changchengzhani]
MGKYSIVLEKNAEKQIKLHFKSGNKASIKKINQIFDELVSNPYFGTGEPEALKYSLSNFWSRKINQKDRMIYRVDENIVTVFIIAAMGHYSDK